MNIVIEDLKIKSQSPMKLFCDNKPTINIAHNHVLHDKTKHIDSLR